MKRICSAFLALLMLFSRSAFAAGAEQVVPPFSMPLVSAEEEMALLLLESAYDEVDAEKQIALVLEAVTIAPASVTILVSGALILYLLNGNGALDGEYETLLRQAYAVAEDSEQVEVLRMLAEHLVYTDRLDETLALVEQAVGEAPTDDSLRMLLAMALYYNQQNNQALELLEAIAEDSPENIEALALRAAIILDECRWDDAIDAYAQLRDNFPEYLFGLHGLYMAYAASGQFEKATRTIDELIRQGGDPSLFVDRARIRLTRQRNPQRALQEADAIIRSNPDAYDGYMIAISALVQMEDFQRAGEYADIVADKDMEYGLLMHSMIAQDADRWVEAERLQRGIIQRAPDYPYAYQCLSVTLLNGKCDLAGAMEALAQSASLYGKLDKEFYIRLGELHAFARNPLEAARGYEEAIRQTFDDPSPLLSLLCLYLEAGREQDMLRTIDRMEKHYPGWIETMYARVLVEDARGNGHEALDAFQRIKEKFPFMAGKLINMEGVLLAAVGDANGPILIAENMRLKDTEDAASYSDLGFAYLLLGETDKAAQALDKAEQLIDQSMLPFVLSVRKTQAIICANRAEMSLQRGNVAQSVDLLEKAAEYGLYPTTLAWGDNFSVPLGTERGKALLALLPSPDEPWDLSVPPQLPEM